MRPEELADGPLGIVLAPFGALYGAAADFRVRAYRKGWRKSFRPPMPTLSIGNLSAGGTGKTPLLFRALETLESHDHSVGVLSRGYGGDEGRMLEERHPEVRLAEDPDRVRALQQFLLQEPPEILLLDDGFQHLRLQRDVDVVLIDATRPFGRCFPAGLFREAPAALRRADLVVVTRADLVDGETRQRIWERVAAARRGLPDLPVVEGTIVLRDARNLATGVVEPPEMLQGRRALLAAGIGNPLSFVRLCESHGVHVADTQFPRDHHGWQESEKSGWHEFEHVLVTEKDGVKLRDAVAEHVWELRVDFRFLTGEEHWNALLEGLMLPVRAARIEPLWAAADPGGRTVS